MASPTKKSAAASPSPFAARPPTVKFARRTSSGRIVNLSRDNNNDDMEFAGGGGGGSADFSNDFANYTVMMPPTPDNQPMGGGGGDVGTSNDRPPTLKPGDQSGDGKRGKGRGVDEEGGGYGGKAPVAKPSNNNKSMLLRSQTGTGEFDHNRWLFESRGTYGYGNAFWPQDEDGYGGGDGIAGVNMSDFMDKPWKPLTRKVATPPEILSPYRCAS